MQAKPKIGRILTIALVGGLALIVAIFMFGGANKTLFNLPAIPLRIGEGGALQAFGFTVTYLPTAVIDQLTAGGVQKLEVRTGHNGIHIYLNGEDMPFIEWGDESVATLQEVLRTLPNVPNGSQIASAIPLLRKIGLGAAISLPGSEGQEFTRWSGETALQPGEPPETTIGPATIGLLAFDEQGNATIAGIPAANLGIPIPPLQADTLGIINSLGIVSTTISTTPTGLEIVLDDRPLPRLAYNAEYLQRLSPYLPAFISDPQMVDTVSNTLSILPGAAVNIAVSFDGQPAAETDLGVIDVSIREDGALQALGLPVAAAGTVPADAVANLQAANVQQLNVDIDNEGIFLAANGQILPSITLNDESAAMVADLVGTLAGQDPETVSNLLGIVRDTGIHLNLAIPAAEGAALVEIPAEIDRTMQAPELGEMAPAAVVLNLVYDGTELVSIGNIPVAALAALGVTPPAMPTQVADIMAKTDSDELRIRTEPNQLIVSLDGADALALNYDQPSLSHALEIAKPFLGESMLTDGSAISKLILGQILPLAPGAAIDLTITQQ